VITRAGTFVGGFLHTLPFLIPHYRAALVCAVVVVALEMHGLAWIRRRFFRAGFASSLAWIVLAATVIVVVSGALGATA